MKINLNPFHSWFYGTYFVGQEKKTYENTRIYRLEQEYYRKDNLKDQDILKNKPKTKPLTNIAQEDVSECLAMLIFASIAFFFANGFGLI